MTTQLKTTNIPSCKITNNSGQSIVILNAENHKDAKKFEVLYEQQLTFMTLGSGGHILENGKTDTLSFTDTVEIDGTAYPSENYNLIIANASNFAPIKVVSEDSQSDDLDNPTFTDITVTSDDAKQMSSALFFTQMISAYPSSNLAKTFTDALKATDGLPLDKTEDSMNKFFQGAVGFTNVDWLSYLAASTYTSNFAASWVPPLTNVPYNTDKLIPPHSTYCYWLYSQDNMGGGTVTDTGRPPAKTASCFGAVIFKDFKGSQNLDPSDPNSGWTVVFSTDGYAIDGGNSTTPLSFNQGQFFNSSSVLGIYLQGVWGLQSTFTGNKDDNNLVPFLVGTVDGKKVIGIPLHPQDGWDKFASFWQNLTFMSVINYFLMIVGIWMAIDFLKSKVGAKTEGTKEAEAENKGKELTPEQEQQINNQADTAEAATKANNQQLADNLGKDPTTGDPNVTVPDETTLAQAQQAAQDAQVKAANERVADGYTQSVNETKSQIKTLEEYGNTPELQEARLKTEIAEKDFRSGDIEAGKAKLGEATDTINAETQRIGDGLSNDAQQALNEEIQASQEIAQDTEESSEKAEEEANDAKSGDTPEGAEGFEPPVVEAV